MTSLDFTQIVNIRTY